VVWDLGVLLTVGIAIAQLRLHPAVIAFFVIGGAFVAAIQFWVWTLSNPRWNLVELESDCLRILIGQSLFAMRVEIPYSRLERIREDAVHTFWPIWVWPYRPLPAHVDLVLSRPQAMPWRLGRLKVIHLRVADGERFVSELREALAHSGHLAT